MTNFEGAYMEEKWMLEKINKLALNDPSYLINYVEDSFKNKVKKTIEYILERKNSCKIILVSGPSSSGKTTFANMLCKYLEKAGIWAEILPLDNFYQGIKKVPRLEDGTKDFESIDGLDVNEIKKCLLEIIKIGNTTIPTYDFSKMAPSKKKENIKLPDGGVLIMEGLHAISPAITEGLAQQSIIKIYINVKGGIRDEEGVFFPPKFIRLMRRIERDYKYRYTLPARTILMWQNVSRGEKLYVRPLRKFADISINSLHAYEPCVMAREALDLMKSVPKEIDMNTFSDKLKQFNWINENLVPKDSLLREFI
ncbi:MAG: Uridine kinase [Eubacteriales bacterium SKADARSKE-1]|nr:Uridine kinase [Eubacteriales bacterium SKADARSKE-1]